MQSMEHTISIENLDFKKSMGLLPVIVQNAMTDEVLMLGYVNPESLQQTIDIGLVTFYSRSRSQIWVKGETSGNYLKVVSIHSDCDEDTLLIKVNPSGPTCHKGTTSCFGTTPSSKFLYRLEQIIEHRKTNTTAHSYTQSLLDQGIQKVAQKVGEEAVELILEAQQGSYDRFLNEAADLFYHFLVLLQARNLSLYDLEQTLASRHKE